MARVLAFESISFIARRWWMRHSEMTKVARDVEDERAHGDHAEPDVEPHDEEPGHQRDLEEASAAR